MTEVQDKLFVIVTEYLTLPGGYYFLGLIDDEGEKTTAIMLDLLTEVSDGAIAEKHGVTRQWVGQVRQKLKAKMIRARESNLLYSVCDDGGSDEQDD